MTQEPLFQALGTRAEDRATRGMPRGLWIGLLGCAIAASGVAAVLVHHNRPAPADVAVAAIEVAPKPAPPTPAALPATSPNTANGDSVEIQHGVKIIRLAPATSTASIAIPVPGAAAAALKSAPDPRLVETTRLGALPRVGPDGARPAVVYARPVPPATGTPRVALVVAGMGLVQGETAQLARRLPPAITFAFPPDAPDLTTQVAETRAAGHEVILQLPDGAAIPAEGEALDGLHRMMTRFSGYAGVSLPPGAAASDRTGVLRDLARRGLYVVEAAAGATPRDGVRGVDVGIGPGGGRPALDRLAAIAKARGSAIGWVAGRGIDAEALAGFAGNGLDLVPLSALADGGASAAPADP